MIILFNISVLLVYSASEVTRATHLEILTHIYITITVNVDVVVAAFFLLTIVPVLAVSDSDGAVRVDVDASAVWFVVSVHLTNVVLTTILRELDISFGVDTEVQVVANTYVGASFNGIDCV